MATTPEADLEITPALVRALLNAQRPDLAGLPLSPFANGWDNAIFRLGEHLLVRLPRRAMAVALLGNEQRWLPGLAATIRVPVPTPVFVGLPEAVFPRPWSLVPFLPGRLLAEVPLGARSAAAMSLADMLVALHTPAPPDAPRNPGRGVPLQQRGSAMLDRLRETPGFGAPAVERWQAWATAAPHTGPALWLHGDPHPLNLLVDADGGLSAVLDWGDVCAGDPASDLAVAWLAFDGDARTAFVERCNHNPWHDEAAWNRARAWALGLAALFVSHSDDAPGLAAAGWLAARSLLAD